MLLKKASPTSEKKTCVQQTVFCFITWLIFSVFSFSAFAEGSKDLINNGGQRAYLLSTNTATEYNAFPTLGTVKVYVKEGETLYMGSSAQGLGNGTIIAKPPNGATPYTSLTGSTNLIGRIYNLTEEKAGPLPNAGGYTPFTRVVTAAEEGIWEIDFISPNVNSGVAANRPGKTDADATWSQANNTAYISAFDVTVKDKTGSFLTGRAFMNVFGGSLNKEDALFNAKFKVLTKDGYIYNVDNNGQAGNIFVFFINNKGFRDGAGIATYKSVNTSTNPPVHDPRLPDTGTDITHKIFFNQPNTDLPANAPLPVGSTWLFKTPESPSASDFLFTGKEGTLYQGGTFPLGGNITFNSNQAISYTISFDVNADGDFTDPGDVVLRGTAVIGKNTHYWDGKAQDGTIVGGNFTFSPSNVKIVLKGGEIHFPFLDVENNVNGIIITRTNGDGSPNDIVYWDDDIPGINGTEKLEGANSTTNGHKWGDNNYKANAFGDLRGLDTWTYVESVPINPLMNISLKQADLQLIDILPDNSTYCVGEEITYTVRVKNGGPDHVTGAKFAFNYPSGFEFVSVGTQTYGEATLYNNSSNATQFTATVDIENQAILTLTLKGKMNAAGTLNTITASIMRPADVTDPDATNPDAAPPTDPSIECIGSCNNIKPANSVAITSRLITIGQPVKVLEGTSATNTAKISIPISIPTATSCPITVTYTVVHGTTSAADFDSSVPLTGTVTIPKGALSVNLDLLLNSDMIIEGHETFEVRFKDPIGGELNNFSVTGTIENDDFGPITITKTDGNETGSIAGSFIFSFPPGVTSDVPTTIEYVLGGTATQNKDYTGPTGTIIIPAGENSISLPILVEDDDIVEGDETVTIAITRLVNAHVGTISNNSPVTPVVTIFDNDEGLLTLSDDVEFNETNSGTVTATFTLTLDKETEKYFTLNYSTEDGTAKSSDLDYVASGSVQLNFNGTANESKTITVTVNGDTKIEAKEFFNLLISNLSDSFGGRLKIPRDKGMVTILNDDSGEITITKADGAEGVKSGSFVFSFLPGLKADVPIIINYTLSGTAIAGTDYTHAVTSSGTLVIPVGAESVPLILPVTDDYIVEGTETVTITATADVNPYGIVVANSPQTINILDNDVALITVTPEAIVEGNSGTSLARFRVKLDNATGVDFKVGYSTTDGTAIAGEDYVAPAVGSFLSFDRNIPNQEKVIEIVINGDRKIEADEVFNLFLSIPSNPLPGILSLQTTSIAATIPNDDSGIISITKTDGAETGEVPGSFIFSFPAGYTSDKPTTINYTLSGTAAYTGSNIDYTPEFTGSIVIPANTNSITLNLAVKDDALVEDDETVNLINVSVNSIYPGISLNPAVPPVVTITDNDNATLVLSGPVDILEGDNGGTVVVFTVTLDKATKTGFSLGYTIEDGTALVSDNDYVSGGSALTFLGTAGETQEIRVTINGDRKIEPDETFTIKLSNPIPAFNGRLTVPLSSRNHVFTIKNDDTPAITIEGSDGAEGSYPGKFTFRFPAGVTSTVPTVINYTLSGTATAGTDYTEAITGTVTIPAGAEYVELPISVTNDEIVEGTETVTITASVQSNPYGIVVANSPQTIDILDDDFATLSISGPVSITEGNTGTVTYTYNVTLSHATGSDFTVNYTTVDGTASENSDYVKSFGVLSFDGTTDNQVRAISVTINGDFAIEADETFKVILSDLSANFNNRLKIDVSEATTYILNDDGGDITIVTTDASEQDEVPGKFTFRFAPGVVSDQPTVINYTLGGTAGNSDHTAVSGSVTILAGEEFVELPIPVKDDNIVEDTETVTLTIVSISNPHGLTAANTFASLNIIDNDVAELILVGPSPFDETHTGTTDAVFKLSLDKEVQNGFTISYNTVDGTALVGDDDYIPASNLLSFNGTAGETKTIIVKVNGDTKIEADETFKLTVGTPNTTFSTPSKVIVPVTSSTATIKNDDGGAITITKTDGEEGVKGGSFTFAFPAGVSSDVATVIHYTLSGTATGNGKDYTGDISGTITIPVGQNSITLDLPVLDDNIIEDTETVVLTTNTVENPYGITITNSPQSINILDNDKGTITISPASIKEGNDGTSFMEFTITLDKEISSAITLNYTTLNGTATVEDGDYELTSGTLPLGPNAGTGIIKVPITADRKIETDETFKVKLSGLSESFKDQLKLTVAEAIGTIENDDASIISITSTDGYEEGAVPGRFIFSFAPGYSSDQPTLIHYTLSGTAEGAGKDYDGTTSGTVIIPAKENSVPLTLPVKDDVIVEETETVVLTTGTVDSPYGFIVSNSPHSLNIIDNDAATLTLSGPSPFDETHTGTTDAVFKLSLDKEVQNGFTISYATVDGTALVGDSDYIPASGLLSFNGTAGETKTIIVKVNGDKKIEADETFLFTVGTPKTTFSSPSKVLIPVTSSTATIKNDDGGAITITKTDGQEGVKGGSFIFAFPAGVSSDVATVIHYTLSGTAEGDGKDYTGAISGTITIPEKQNSITLNLPVLDDNIIEDTETVILTTNTVENPYGITIANSPQSINILDNDKGTITISPASIKEGNDGTSFMEFTITLDKEISSAITLNYTTLNGTATVADGDYEAASGTITLGPNAGTEIIKVPVIADRKIEADETFKVKLSGLSESFKDRLKIAVAEAIGTIENDDASTIHITSTDGYEEGAVPGRFIFSFAPGYSSDQPTLIHYTLSGTAEGAGKDYDGTTSGTVIIPAKETSAPLTLPVKDDAIVEETETVVLSTGTVDSPYGFTVSNSPYSLNIIDNDAAALTLSDDVVITEGDSGTKLATFTLTLNKATSKSFKVGYSTADGTATIADNDYISANGVLEFSGLINEKKTITITVNGDTKIEANELFSLNVSILPNPFDSRLTIEPTLTRTVTIQNDDTGTIAITKVHGHEGVQDGNFIFSFPAGLSTDIPVVINYTLTGTAKGNGEDYTSSSPVSITLPAKENSVTLKLLVNDDDIIEDTETVDIFASAASNAYGITISNPSESINILDNDDATLSISSASITEGNTGTKTLDFIVTLNKATGSAFEVGFSTLDGTATIADEDYKLLTNVLSFEGKAGETQTISVIINGDKKIEADETFQVRLNTLSKTFNNHLQFRNAVGTGTILNDDSGIIDITKIDGSETGPTAGKFIFTFRDGVTSDQPTTIGYSLTGTAGGNGQDYTGATSGSVIIPERQSSGTLMLPVIDDPIIEGDENVTLSVTSINSPYAIRISVNPLIPILNIADNDFASLSLSAPVILMEGNTGTTAFNFTVKLDKPTNAPFTVKYRTQDGTATVLDGDYIQNTGTLNFAGTAGETQTITVLAKGDFKLEADEIFSVILDGLSNSFGDRLKIQGSSVTGTIRNDDAAEINVTKIDGTEGLQDAKFIFSFPQGVVSDAPTIINYNLSGTATSADYTPPLSRTITIPAGVNSYELVLPVIDDNVMEETESINITIVSINNIYNNITWKLPIPTLFIFDNDNATLTLSNVTPVLEQNSGTTAVTFTLTLDKLVSKSFDIDYSTLNGTATVADKDYEFKSGRITFAGFAGETHNITLLVKGDIKVEEDEEFTLVLDGLNPTFSDRLTIAGNPGVITILNDDFVPVANPDFITTPEDTPVTFSIIANDTDANGIDPKTITLTSLPAKGTLKANDDGTVTYTPALNDFGTHRFTYTVKDILGLVSNEATVTITITPVNDAPVAEDDVFYVFKNTSIRETVSNNDSDPDGDVLQYKLLSSTKNGQLQFFNPADGSFIYTPQNGFVGIDGFTYEVNDPAGLTDQANVILNVQPNVTVNLTPVDGVITEGDSISITAQLNEPLLQDVAITLSYAGTALNDKDYSLSQNYQTITIPSGSITTTQKLIVSSIKDYLKEGDEEINIRIATVTPSAFVTIGTGSDITIKDYYPEDENTGPDENADISPDPLTSPNGDGIGNEKFVIHNIEKYPDNEVMIFNRWGNEVYRIQGYNNDDKSFKGIANKGILANSAATLVDGVYYFIIYTKDSNGARKMNKGYVIIKR